MTNVEAAEFMLQLFKDIWTPTGYRYTLVNESFNPPQNNPWARFTIKHNESFVDTLGPIGKRRFNRAGSCFTQIFTRVDSGTHENRRLIDIIMDGFEGTRIIGSSICFQDVVPRETGPQGKWYQSVVEAEFRYNQTK